MQQPDKSEIEIASENIYAEMLFMARVVETKYGGNWQNLQFRVRQSVVWPIQCHDALYVPDDRKPDSPFIGYLFNIPIFSVPDADMPDCNVRIVDISNANTETS